MTRVDGRLCKRLCKVLLAEIGMPPEMSGLHPRLITRYREAISHALLPPQSGKATITPSGGSALECDVRVTVGPDGVPWVWFTPTDGSIVRLLIEQRMTKLEVDGHLADGRAFVASECYFDVVGMNGRSGTAQHGLSGWQIKLDEPAVFTVLLMVGGSLRVSSGPPPSGDRQVEYTLLNAIFDGIDKTSYDEGRAHRVDRFTVKTQARNWTLRTLRSFDRQEKEALDSGSPQFLPTATASTSLARDDELAPADEDAHIVSLLLSLAIGAAVRWTARRVADAQGEELLFAGYRPSSPIRNRTYYELISNHRPAKGLESFLSSCVDEYRSARSLFGLDRAIGFLEESRVQPTVDVQLLLALLALESLTYYWCLDAGLSSDQLKEMNIEEKLNRMHSRFPNIHRRIVQTQLLRTDVRNPLVHRGEIPAMTVEEMVWWAERLYVLAFRIITNLLGYTGSFGDPTKSHAETPVSF